MRCTFFAASLATIQLCLVTPSIAGLKADLANCASGKGEASARACTRVLKSGRLKKSHRYIAYYNRGWAHRNSGELEAALSDFNRSLRFNSKFADSYYSRSVLSYELGKPEVSVRNLERYLNLRKSNWKAYYKRALMLRRLGKFELALADLEQAEKLKPSKAIDFLTALVLSDQGEHGAALNKIGRDVGASCRSARECYSRSIVLKRKQLLDEALEDINNAIGKRKVYAAAFIVKGRILEKMGRRDQSEKAYKKSISLDVGSVEELLAQKDARDYLTALQVKDKLPVAKSVATSKTAFACRRFSPTSNSTISVPCN